MAGHGGRFCEAGHTHERSYEYLQTCRADAQHPQAIRGTIDKIDGGFVSIKQANGADVDVKLLDNAKVFGVQAATIADVKPNDFIGVGAMPQPDGSQKAIQVTYSRNHSAALARVFILGIALARR